MSRLDGLALITGASSGIGRAIAEELAARGLRLVLCGRDDGRLRQVAAALPPQSAPITIAADLADEGTPARIGKQVGEAGRLEVLVHSAGALHLGSAATATAAQLDDLYRVNLRAPILLTRALLPWLRDSRGQVVFVNSSAALAPGATNGLYAATKAGLAAFAQSLREEVNADGIRVLSVFAGRTATPMQQQVSSFEGTGYHPQALLQPEDVARAVADALALPETAEVMDLRIRPMRKSPDRGGAR
jgi:short-subunit dehydrogenase